jgi:membrane-associated phospholipid phosphatase
MKERSKSFFIFLFFVLASQKVPAKDTIEQIGDYFQVISPAYAFGMAMKENDYGGMRQFLYSFGAMEASVFGLKSMIDKERPDRSDKKSFPSGHTAAAFSGAAFIHKRYGLKQSIVPYLMAAFTGYSRVEAKKHYPRDVLAGAVIASLWVWILVDRENNINLAVDKDGAGFSFRTEF